MYLSDKPTAIANVKISNKFWGGYQKLIRESVLPYQWEALNDRIADADRSGCIHNFLIAAGRKQGAHYGWYFQDSDLYKWIEAIAYVLEAGDDDTLREEADWVIRLMEEAQRPDGYLDTFYQVAHPGEEWTCLREYHELYCAGHLIEAAVAYSNATGDDRLLGVATRFADLIMERFGDGDTQCKGYPGHEELELALVKLSEKTGKQEYADLAAHFVYQRGTEPNYFKEELKRDPTTRYPWGNGPLAGMRYFQADKPVTQQERAYGHAVRACYFYSGIADVARINRDDTLRSVARRMFDNVSGKQMYVTGAIGSSGYGEAFTYDYDLPNDSVYGETCASIALAFFARRMLQMEGDSRYADVMERAIYNTALAGMSLSGTNFFYVNPLEIDPETLPYDYYKKHVLPQRPKWYGCACCPPNIARLVSSISQYAYLENSDAAKINLFIGGSAVLPVSGFRFDVETDYPWNGNVTVRIRESRGGKLFLRMPDWCPEASVEVNGKVLKPETEKGYFVLNGLREGDVIRYLMQMPVRRVRAFEKVKENAGCVAVQRGPVVYCAEEIDNGKELYNLYLPQDACFDVEWREDLLGGVNVIRTGAIRVSSGEDTLYSYDKIPEKREQKLTLIPYFRWNNRGIGEMRVYLKENVL